MKITEVHEVHNNFELMPSIQLLIDQLLLLFIVIKTEDNDSKNEEVSLGHSNINGEVINAWFSEGYKKNSSLSSKLLHISVSQPEWDKLS